MIVLAWSTLVRYTESLGHCGVAALRWPSLFSWLPIHVHSILSPNTIIRHHAFNVKTWQSVWQCFSRKFLFHTQNGMYISHKTSDLWGGSPPHRWVHPFLQSPTHSIKNKTDTTWKAMSVRYLKFNFIYHNGLFLYCTHNLGQFVLLRDFLF